MDALADPGDLEWHFIGGLQGNKARLVAARFAWVHTLDRLAIAQRLASARPPLLPPLNACIQVNISNETTKGGLSPEAAVALAPAIAGLPGIALRGFMGIAAPMADPAVQRRQFRILAECLDASRANGLDLDTLSMGMSADLEAAIAEGATLIRVGSAIFGARPAP
jgi:pyridoxal phosphate enzyme (YggS family)